MSNAVDAVDGANGAATGVAERPDAAAAKVTKPSAYVPPRAARVGEELPIFCERCGYSLHGLFQIRCEACEVLHFSCPECNYHQPINTLRPAVQRVLGRLRALGLATIVFLKINYFFWPLFGWAAAGGEIAYRYDYQTGNGQYGTAPFDEEGGFVIFLFAAAFAAIGRMLLLRWGRGVLVGLAMGGLIVFALIVGSKFYQAMYYQPLPSPLTFAFSLYLLWAFAGAWAGAACVWGIWLALAHAFLPKQTAVALIEWQRAMSDPKARVKTDTTNSVMA